MVLILTCLRAFVGLKRGPNTGKQIMVQLLSMESVS